MKLPVDHRDHVNLLRDGVPEPGGIWADFGSGRGSFTLALAELLGPGGTIYSIEKDGRALNRQEEVMKSRFPAVDLHYHRKDLSKPIDLPVLDGLVAANVLHFWRDKEKVLTILRGYLRPGGRFIVVEYNSNSGNHWVPYPFSYETWAVLADQIGFVHTELLATVPSSFMGEIYSAVSW